MICRIEVEGIDRTGKDTLVGYLDYMSNRQLPICSRGLLSTLAYNAIYSRFMSDSREKEMIKGNKETLIVLLYADIEDLEIRYKMSNEQMINIQREMTVFEDYAGFLKNEGINVLKFNTTEMTPYKISEEIIKYIKEENKK